MAVNRHAELISEQEWVQLKEYLGLSPRQARIVRSLMDGKADKQIAYELDIALSTVRTHMGRLFRRFDLNDRVKLILHVFACLRGLRGSDSWLSTSDDSEGLADPQARVVRFNEKPEFHITT